MEKCVDGGSEFSLRLCYKYRSETVVLGLIVFHNIDNRIPIHK